MTYKFMLVIQCVSIVILALECIYVFFNMKTKGQQFLFLFCMCAFTNNVCYLTTMTADNVGEAFISGRLSYLGQSWLVVSFFAMLMELCHVKIPKVLIRIMIAFQVVIFVAVLSSPYHNLYYNEERLWVESGLFPHKAFGAAIIYRANMAVTFVYVAIGLLVLCITAYRDRNKVRQKMYALLLLSIATMVLGLVVYLLKLTDGYNSTSLGYAITAVILAITIFKYQMMDMLTLVKDNILDTLPEGIAATDHKGHIVYLNNKMKELFPDIETNSKEAIDKMNAMVKEGAILKTGESIYDAACDSLYRGSEEVGVVYLMNDVTVRYKHMEELQEQKDIAEAANASKSKFLSIVSHEIRTPMNAVVGMTEILLNEPEKLDETQTKYLRNIKTSGDSLVLIVNDILDQSKLEAGKMEIVEEAYELHAMIEDIRLIIENRIGSKPITFLCEMDEGIPDLLIGDSLRIRQILINLMNNAVKFTDKGFVKLRISNVQKEDNRIQLRVAVEDSGQGIKPEDLSKLGEAFTRVDTKKNYKKEGTGLGLSISRNFVSLMGGQLEVNSEYGKGSEFFFSIWQGVVAKESGEENVTRNVTADSDFCVPDARILVVDDTEINLMVMTGMFQNITKHLDIAESGEKAIEMIKSNHYDLVFMDYMMPDMDGAETTKRIRKESTNAEHAKERQDYFLKLPIIALSGDDSEASRELFTEVGMNDFTIKPVDRKRLKTLLLKWLPQDMIQVK